MDFNYITVIEILATGSLVVHWLDLNYCDKTDGYRFELPDQIDD